MHVSMYALKNLDVRYVQGKKYEMLKKNTRALRVYQKQRMKNLFDFTFFEKNQKKISKP